MRRCTRKMTYHHSGFTLLEMVLVLFIMATLATVSLSFIDGEDAQLRYEQSLQKLNAIGQAVMKVSDHGRQQVMSGFVFDNGVLPPEIITDPESLPRPLLPLMTMHEDWSTDTLTAMEWDTYGAKIPHYYEDSHRYTLNDYPLFKGYRQGYLPASLLDSKGDYKDAWGVPFIVTHSPDKFAFAFDFSKWRADGNSETADNRDKFIDREIHIDDWSIDANQLSISISNNGSAIDDHELVLFIYQNTTHENKWQQHSTDVSIAGGETHHYGQGGKTLGWNGRIPVGTHLIVIIDKLALPPGDISQQVKSAAPITVFPRSAIPLINLSISS